MSDARIFTIEPLTGGGAIPDFPLGYRLRRAREFAGLEQAELAKLTSLSRATISAAENGHRAPRNASVRLWAVATGVNADWLATGKAPQDGPEGPSLPEMDSNHQPAGNTPTAPVTSITERRARRGKEAA